MADPLAAMAEREVPAPTNYFDPAAAQTVISRYSNSRRMADASGAALDRVSKVQNDSLRYQDAEARMKREAVMQDREDLDYMARKDALARQGEFLSNLNGIDPEDPDYDTKVTEFMTSLPPELHDEPAVKSIFAFKNQVADDARRRRDTEKTKTQAFDNQMAMFKERAKYNSALKGITDDDVKAATMPDGSIDMLSLGMKAAARDRGYKEGEFDRRLKAVNEGRIRIMAAADLSKKGRERRANVDKFIVEDRAAFPRQIDTVVGEYKKATGKTSVDPAMLEVNSKWRDQMAKAKTWDAKPLDNELSAAFAYDDPEKYVNLVPGLTESQKERRRMVWEHAHKDGAVEEDTPQKEASPPAETQRPAAGGASKNPLTREAAAQFKEQAKGNRAEAERLAREAGFDF